MRWLIAVLLALFAASPAFAAHLTLSGQVTYRERSALPDGAILEIQLLDQTLPSLPPRVDVKAPIGPGQVPLNFTLAFDDAIIIPTHSYAIVASIGIDKGTLFRNTSPYVVDPLNPAQPVVVVLSPALPPAPAPASSAEPSVPVEPAILHSVWTARSIGGNRVVLGTRPSISIGSDLRAGGSDGCNSWFAPAELQGEMLHIGTIASTRMACADAVNQQAAAFTAALGAVGSWRVDGDQLTLFGIDGRPLLDFTR